VLADYSAGPACDPNANPPATARDSGHQLGESQLWPDDSAYKVSQGRIEQLPRATELFGCA